MRKTDSRINNFLGVEDGAVITVAVEKTYPNDPSINVVLQCFKVQVNFDSGVPVMTFTSVRNAMCAGRLGDTEDGDLCYPHETKLDKYAVSEDQFDMNSSTPQERFISKSELVGGAGASYVEWNNAYHKMLGEKTVGGQVRYKVQIFQDGTWIDNENIFESIPEARNFADHHFTFDSAFPSQTRIVRAYDSKL